MQKEDTTFQGFTVVVKKWYDTKIWGYSVFFGDRSEKSIYERFFQVKVKHSGRESENRRMNILAPSILSADCTILGEQIEDVKKGGARYLHIDVMDGMFVPAISFGMTVVGSLRKIKDIVFDVHLMVKEPIRYIEDFAKCGADIITVHLEACEDIKATLLKIHECGCKVGLSIKPGTPIAELMPWLELVDMVLVMSVEPGFGGQKYIEESTERIREVRKMITASGKVVDLEVDGGVNLSNVEMILEAGANIIVAGSAVFKGDVLQNTKDFMKKIAE